MPKFMADSNYDTETDKLPAKRKRIRNSRLDSSSSDEELPISKKSKKSVPAPPAIPTLKRAVAGRKGQGGPSKEDLKKQERKDLMKRLAAARAAAAAKMAGKQSSPWKVTVSS